MTYVVTEIEQTCRASPSQWEGRTDKDEPVYVRYRWGFLQVTISDPGADIRSAINGRVVFGEQLGDGLHGLLSYEELVRATRGTICWPEAETRGADEDLRTGFQPRWGGGLR